MSSLFAPRLRVAPLALALLLVPAAGALAQDDLAQGLIRLRGEVEQLNGELDLLREEQRTGLAALNVQKAELSASVERQQLAARELREKLQARQAEQAEAGAEGDTLRPLLLDAVARLRAQIAAGLPFKVEERLGELDQFRVQLENGTLPPQRAVNRLWAFHEDEFRLSRENGLYSQTIEVGGERVLAEVAKVGGMALYFRTPDGRYGQARRAGEGWVFEPFADPDDAGRAAAYYDSLRKQIRQGYFELPLAQGGSR